MSEKLKPLPQDELTQYLVAVITFLCQGLMKCPENALGNYLWGLGISADTIQSDLEKLGYEWEVKK